MKPESVSTKQERIAKLARSNPGLAFTSLNQYLDYEWVKYAYERTRKDGALGVDGQSAEDYAAKLEAQHLYGMLEMGAHNMGAIIAQNTLLPDVPEPTPPKRTGLQRLLGG